ncbi:sigma-70 family RNA polymerase sigma factor [Candidatus Peregrinibacteria bacterium]|nr:sigma-70 family RNA polymerase sigma factor [Candidatus Peregrinibacteria bacterium]
MVLMYDSTCKTHREIAKTAADIIATAPTLDSTGDHTPLRQCALIRDALLHAMRNGKTSKTDIKNRIQKTMAPEDEKRVTTIRKTVSKNTSEHDTKSSIHTMVSNLQSGNKQEQGKACKNLMGFIHFYIRKIRHQGPVQYKRHEQSQPNGTHSYDFEDATQYIFLQLLENITKIDLSFHEAQVRAYLNTMIQRAYGKWKIHARRLVRIPESVYYRNSSCRHNAIKQRYISIDQPIACCEDQETIRVQEIIKNLHDNTTPETHSLQNDIHTKIHELLDTLPAKMSTVITLRFLHGKTLKEIGGEVCISAERTRQIIEEFYTILKADGPAKKGYKKAKEAYQTLQSMTQS